MALVSVTELEGYCPALPPTGVRRHLAATGPRSHTALMATSEAADQRVIDAVMERTRSIVESLSGLDDDELRGPSELPEWSRLTIACHLRFGAGALSRMTRSAVQGLPAAYYPGGREVQRRATLVPLAGESPQDVVDSLARHGEELNELWTALHSDAWARDRRASGQS